MTINDFLDIHSNNLKKDNKTCFYIPKDRLTDAAKVMSASFYDDPSIRYLLGGNSEGEHDWLYFLSVLKSIHGKCIMISSDETIQDLLILFPPTLKGVPLIPFLTNGGIKVCYSFGIGLLPRSLNYENNCKKIKERTITPDTWYCMCFVVLPKAQGHGVGSQLIKPVLEIFENNNIPIYLETHKQTNVEIYKHYGFKTIDQSPIPKTDIIQYSMFRQNTNIQQK